MTCSVLSGTFSLYTTTTATALSLELLQYIKHAAENQNLCNCIKQTNFYSQQRLLFSYYCVVLYVAALCCVLLYKELFVWTTFANHCKPMFTYTFSMLFFTVILSDIAPFSFSIVTFHWTYDGFCCLGCYKNLT